MATTILFTLFVSLLIRAAFTLPISQDLKSMSSSDITQDDEPTRNTVVGDLDTMLSVSEDTELKVKSLDSVSFDGALKRTKRDLIKGNQNCAEGMVWYWNMCLTPEKYEELNEDYYDDDES